MAVKENIHSCIDSMCGKTGRVRYYKHDDGYIHDDSVQNEIEDFFENLQCLFM